MTLAAFWTVGCRFEGQQVGLAEAWFAIYPAIANFVLIYFSLLNLLAKALRRRMSDGLFTPTVVALCVLHYFRLDLAASGWLKGIDSRIPTVVFSDEVKKLRLSDYFTTDIAWRMNGRVPLIFGVKLAILAANLLPLVFAHSFPVGNRCAELGLHGVEKALALRAKHVGGLGRSLTYIVAVVDRKEHRISSISFTGRLVKARSNRSGNQEAEGNEADQEHTSNSMMTTVTPLLGQAIESPSNADVKDSERDSQRVASHEVVFVNSYELIRLGYLVFGDKYLITFDGWDLLSAMAPFKSFCHL
ncbi:putative transmembrane protein [Phytophthora cinnamomi]|uniref:putative transmembrane protein n=1 Tax=Phytophthora cinnamomi TaxID=4785 RepID=UPI0035595C1E|nr:putative transmembrane protein [Phytophthora cinnamomi]